MRYLATYADGKRRRKVRRARKLNAILGGCLLWAIALSACGESNQTRHPREASSGAPAAGGDAGGGESSPGGNAGSGARPSGGNAGSGESSPGGGGQTGGQNSGESGGAGGGDCEDCSKGGSAGATSGTPNACKAKADKTPNMPEPTSLDADAVARAATVVGSCIPDDGVARNAAHIWLAHLADDRPWFRFAAQLDCLANAACGCQAIEQCLGWGYESVADACAGGCDGSVFHECGDGIKWSVDCARLGLACDAEAGCGDETAVSCSDEQPSCTADGKVRFCDGGFMHETPCASLGFSCVDGECTGKGDPCSADPFPQSDASVPVGTGCQGDVLEACLDGKSTTLACADQGPGFKCQTVGDAHFCGLGADCVPADLGSDVSEPSCDGALLTFCNAGRRERIDCRALGFEGCDVDSGLGHYGCTPVLSPASN